MEIQGPGGVSGPNRIEPQRLTPQRTDGPDVSGKVGDSAEISEQARLLNKLAEAPSIRMERVQELRELIESRQYETPERIRKAVEKLLEEL